MHTQDVVTLKVSKMSVVVRRPWHVYAFTYKTLTISDKWCQYGEYLLDNKSL